MPKKSKGMLKRNKNNQKPYMLDKNQGCKMVYFIKIIEKIFIFLYSGFTFQNPSSRVKSSWRWILKFEFEILVYKYFVSMSITMLTIIKLFKQIFLYACFSCSLFASIGFVIIHHILNAALTLANILFLPFFTGDAINKTFIQTAESFLNI